MKSTKKILLSIASVSPIIASAFVVSCGKGEKANDFAKTYVLGNNGIANYNKDTKTLDLSRATNLKVIPQASFSDKALKILFTHTSTNFSNPQFRLPEGIFDPTTGAINIEKIILPSSITTIESGAFEGLGLKEVKFDQTSSNLTSIQDNAFLNNNLTSLELPESIVNIGNGAFMNNNIKSINLDKLKNFKKLKTAVFANNELSTIDLSNIVEIEESALAMNKFKSITLPNNLKHGNVSEKLFFYIQKDAKNENEKVSLDIKDNLLKDYLKKKLNENKDNNLNYQITN
ncbi:leucine-rich repeat domain-containing protein [Metamycoplasma auris]|uniref:Leucine rich repeat (LRR) protein n=1 Tax=Metamycoplasma auris TaxID=51363 RepID=A0A2W7G1W4_9BACT|nr:leucine-rich repeat domain-containing protein [Metamycoplasma auris]PZW00592.1 leucine rich repeat (LRR) protein [Metamycoplasma auris]